MTGAFLKDLILFLFLCLVVCFVWVSLNSRDFKVIVKEGLKTFIIFVFSAVVLSVIVFFLS